MACTPCCARTSAFIMILFGILMIGIVGLFLPLWFIPNMWINGVQEILLVTPQDSTQNTAKWRDFSGIGKIVDTFTPISDVSKASTMYYVYNISNPREFVLGQEKPNLVEVGPFGYSKFGRRYNVRFLQDDVIAYQSFQFYKPTRPSACLLRMESLGHPNPVECLNHSTKVTTLNPTIARALSEPHFGPIMTILGADGFAAKSGAFIESMTISYKKALYGSIHGGQYFNFHADSSMRALRQAYFTNISKSGKSASDYIRDLNGPTNDSVSPFKAIQTYIPTAKKVFATDAQLEAFFNPNNLFSFFNSTGHQIWVLARKGSSKYLNYLVSKCKTDNTTDCEDRINALVKFSFSSSYWGGEAYMRMYGRFIGAVNDPEYKCANGAVSCGFSYPAFRGRLSYNLFRALFSSNNNGISFLRPESYDQLLKIEKFCRNPAMSCNESISHRTAFDGVFKNVVAASYPGKNPNDLIPQMPASFKNSLIGTTCLISSYVRTQMKNPYYDYVAASILPSRLPKLFEANTELKGMKTLDDLAFQQMANSGIKKTAYKSGDFKNELHHYLELPITKAEARSLFIVFRNPKYAIPIMKMSQFVATPEDPFIPEDFRPNVNADFSSLNLPSSILKLLSRRNTAGNDTIASAMSRMIIEAGHHEYLLKLRYLCNNAAHCDYAKGGLFITTTVERYFFLGDYGSTSNLLFQFQKEKRFDITCLNPNYYYKDGTKGPVKGNEDKLLLDSMCQPFYDRDCSDNGIQVTDKITKLRYNFPRPLSNISDSEEHQKWYRLNRHFRVANMTVSTLAPIQALQFARTYRNTSYHKSPECETCGPALYTGYVDWKNHGKIHSLNGRTSSKRWKVPVNYEGSLSGDLAPRFIEGFEAECPRSISRFSSTVEGPVYLDFIEKTTIDHSNDPSIAIPVCRYAETKESIERTRDNLKNDPKVMPPKGLIPVAPGVNATRPGTISYGTGNFYWDMKFNDGSEAAKFTGVTMNQLHDASYKDIELSTGQILRHQNVQAAYARIRRSIFFPHLQERYYIWPVYTVRSGTSVNPNSQATLGSTIRFVRDTPGILLIVGNVIGVLICLGGLLMCPRKRIPAKSKKGEETPAKNQL